MSLSDAVIGLKAFKEVDQRAKQLWHDLDKAIVTPRMDLSRKAPPGVRAENVSSRLDTSTAYH
jgi:protein transport protein DSL1/ZW10